MKQAKKIFTRMLMNNWGGVSHKVMEFHEYVICSVVRVDLENQQLWMPFKSFCTEVFPLHF